MTGEERRARKRRLRTWASAKFAPRRAGLIRAVILNYNEPEITLRCAASLARQTYEAIEVVVVDNGSTDVNLSRLRLGLPPRHLGRGPSG